MRELKKPCHSYLTNGRCEFGGQCAGSHLPRDSAQPGSSRSTQQGNTAPINKRCNQYWDNGECRKGFGCPYQHIANPAHKSKMTAAGREGSKQINPAGTSASRALDDMFPTYSTINSRVSDELLFPAKMLSPGQAKVIIRGGEGGGRKWIR